MKRVRFASDLFSYCDVLGANVKSSESPLSNVSETVKLSIDIKYQNINGLGDKLGQSDVLADILSRDITIYAEAMKGPNFTCDIPGYWVKSYPHSSHDKCKGRVPGGFVLIVKSSIKKNVKVVKQNDHVVWLCLTNLVEHSCNKIFVGSVYVPHEKSVLRDIDKDEIFSIQQDIEYFSGQGVVYPLGDWNARTGDLLDYIEKRNMVNLPMCVGNITGGTRRLNVDKKVNAHGKKLIDLCKMSGYGIQNGRINEHSSVFTCYRHNGQSCVDYLLSNYEYSHLITN